MLENILKSLGAFQPEVALAITFVLAIFAEFVAPKTKRITGYFVLIGFAVTFYFLLVQSAEPRILFGTMSVVDPFARFFKLLVLGTSSVIVLFSFMSEELREAEKNLGEFYSLIAAMTLGMFVMAGASHMLLMYISLEMVSITSYILAGFMKTTRRSSEASLKYVIFGAIASGLMLYGISILYGLTGSLDIYSVRAALAQGAITVGTWSFAALIGAIVLILAGFGYKISMVPFHFWTPDVYEGAPITVTAYLSVASKAAGMAMMIRFFVSAFMDAQIEMGQWTNLQHIDWNFIIAALSAVTMTLGNIIAVWQDNLKRLLAYSSIAHAGYMLMGVVVMSNLGLTSVLVYLIVYFFMNLGAFFIVMVVADKLGSENIDSYRGLSRRAPFISAAFAIFLISLTGLPPMAGFVGKFYLFTAVLSSPKFLWLAIIGVVNSVISLYYYARVLRNMYLREPDDPTLPPLRFGPEIIVWSLIFIVPNIFFGLYWSPIVNIATRSIKMFLP